ncbi:MAG: silent information regulator protein Sir2 [Planctomycetota bacterium]|nr:MAG: silent information regulator protein Sir2 [Planctomycetota bacterium]
MIQRLAFSIGCVLIVCPIIAQAAERLDRGLVALCTSDKNVYLGWRVLSSDPADVAFHVYRNMADSESARCLTKEPLRDKTNFIDDAAPHISKVSYFVRAVINGQEVQPSKAIAVSDTPEGMSFIRIKLNGNYDAQMAALGDLDGDGRLDYVIKQPDSNIDPWQKAGVWRKSPGTYKIEAYGHDGKFLWRYDMGWAIEQGIWYSPYIVYDLDGDGRAEVYAKAGEGDPRDPDGKVTTGAEWVVKLDGMSGKILKKVPWPDRSGYAKYNWASRNLMAVAYLDGKQPYLIVQRGTYGQIKVDAYDSQLNRYWRWNSHQEKQRYHGSGMHGLHVADVDGDGRDEIILGSAVLDDNGRGVWTNPMHHKIMAHPDVCYVGDINPNRTGLEIFYGFETAQPRDAVCLMDAGTGKILWGFDGPTRHVHAQGMVADIIASYPGQECYAGEQDGSQYWLYAADGRLINKEKINGLSPRPVFWDADPQKELILSGQIADYKGKIHGRIEGSLCTIADCLGDWREEIITSLPGELRIYTTTIPARTKRVCLMQDRLYRLDVAVASMGYYYPPQLSPR